MAKQVSIYANYMRGFENVNGSNFEGNTFDPQRADQFEGGVKVYLFHNRLSGRISFYDILVTNILRSDPKHPNYSIQNGRELSQGFEFRAASNPIPGLNILTAYSINKFKYQKVS